jgi:hypothetical protein
VATPRQILVNQLLLEREALWVRVHEIEREAAKWLGEPYPFERPELPSDRKKKRRARGAGAPRPEPSGRSGADAGAAGAGLAGTTEEPAERPRATADALRRLEEGEASYRVSYAAHGRAATEVHDAFEAVRVAVASQGVHLRVTRIETLDADGAVRATLFPA